MRQYILIIFACLPLFLSSQYSKKEIDSVNQKIFELRKEGNLDGALALCKKILNEKKIVDKNELIKTYIQTGNILSNLSRVKESFDYLELALKENQELQDKILQARIYGEYGRNYKELGFHQKATEFYTKAIDLLENNNAKPKSLQLQYLYSIRGVIYEENGQLDSLYKDLHNAFKFYPDTYSASRLAKYFIVHKKNLDSAKYYLNKGEELFEKDKTPVFQKSVLLRSYGRFYFEKKNYDKAISYYNESLLISQTLNKPIDIRDTNKLLYEVYKAINDDKKANQSLEKYTNINDSLSFEHKKIQETPIKHILKEKEEEVKEKEKNYAFLVFIIILIILVIVYFVFKRISKFNQKEKEDIIFENEVKTQELKLKINEHIDEIIQLAKENTPEFWARFQEVYPDFRNKLLTINPDLKPSEFILSAYIYLGFNTKDIAEYTFKAVKTIKNNKYNLRKRLEIPTKDDFVVWMRSFIDDKSK